MEDKESLYRECPVERFYKNAKKIPENFVPVNFHWKYYGKNPLYQGEATITVWIENAKQIYELVNYWNWISSKYNDGIYLYWV